MTIQEIYTSLDNALVADKSPATEYALAALKSLQYADTGAKLVAVLSTTFLPLDGNYAVTTLDKASVDPYLIDVPHYLGHPDTAKIAEEMGAVKAQSNLFQGLKAGESALCMSIAQGKSTRAKDGFTSPHQNVMRDDLQLRIITRLA